MKKKFSRLTSLYFLAMACAIGCAQTNVRQYTGTQPHFDVRQFFSGPLYAAAITQDSQGKVDKRYEIHMVGQAGRDTVTVQEHFVYFDGVPTQASTLVLQQLDPHKLRAAGEDPSGKISGSASGESYGYAVHLRYHGNFSINGSERNARVDEWMYMVRPDLVIGRSDVRSLGSSLGSVTFLIKKLPPTPQNIQAMSR